MEKVVFVVSVQEQDAWETARSFAADGYRVYGAYTDGVARKEGEKEQVTLLNIDLLSSASAGAAARLVEEQEGRLDILVLESACHAEHDGPVGAHDYELLADAIDRGAGGMERVLEAFLPLLRKGEGKRIAVLSKTNAGIGFCEDTSDYGWHMSQAALNMLEKLYFNALRPEGFTFRNFATDGPAGGMSAKTYIEHDLSNLPEDDYIHSDENRLVRRDGLHRELAW